MGKLKVETLEGSDQLPIQQMSATYIEAGPDTLLQVCYGQDSGEVTVRELSFDGVIKKKAREPGRRIFLRYGRQSSVLGIVLRRDEEGNIFACRKTPESIGVEVRVQRRVDQEIPVSPEEAWRSIMGRHQESRYSSRW